MPELEGRHDVLHDRGTSREAGRLLIGGLHVRLGNLGEADDDERRREKAHGDHESGRGVGDLGLGDLAADEIAEKDRGYRRADRVERAADLDELVALLALAAERVEKRIHYKVQQTHRESCDESARHIDRKALDIARQELHSHTRETDRDGEKRRELVALALQDKAARDAHEEVGEEVRRRAELGRRVRRAELVLYNDSHGAGEVGHESDHEKQRKHRRDRRDVAALPVL